MCGFGVLRQLILEMEGNGVVDLTVNSHDLDRADEGVLFELSGNCGPFNLSLKPSQGGPANETFTISPSSQTVPLVFKYTKGNGSNLKFTSVASFYNNKELMHSEMLRMVWRVCFNADEQDKLCKLQFQGSGLGLSFVILGIQGLGSKVCLRRLGVLILVFQISWVSRAFAIQPL